MGAPLRCGGDLPPPCSCFCTTPRRSSAYLLKSSRQMYSERVRAVLTFVTTNREAVSSAQTHKAIAFFIRLDWKMASGGTGGHEGFNCPQRKHPRERFLTSGASLSST